MPENFIRSNKSLEARIATCTSALEVQNLLQGIPVEDVVSPRSEPQQRPENYAPLRKTVQAPDGSLIRISAASFWGLDHLEAGVKSGLITEDIL